MGEGRAGAAAGAPAAMRCCDDTEGGISISRIMLPDYLL
jgi:hypothetical protein